MFSAGQMQIQKPMQQNPQQFNTMVSTQQAQMPPQSHQLVWQGENWHKFILLKLSYFKIDVFPTLQLRAESRKWFQYAADMTVDSMFHIVKLRVSIQSFFTLSNRCWFFSYTELTLLRLASWKFIRFKTTVSSWKYWECQGTIKLWFIKSYLFYSFHVFNWFTMLCFLYLTFCSLPVY